MEMDLEALNFNFGQLVDRVLWLTDWTRTRWTIAIVVTVAIAAFCITLFIRQQKIMKMLRDLTPPKAESPREEDTAAKETE